MMLKLTPEKAPQSLFEKILTAAVQFSSGLYSWVKQHEVQRVLGWKATLKLKVLLEQAPIFGLQSGQVRIKALCL